MSDTPTLTQHEHTFCPHCNPCRRATEITPLEDVLRSLASYVGNGGYNAPTVDATEFEAKIRDGIDRLVSAAESKVDALMREKEELIERCAKVCEEKMAHALRHKVGAPWVVTPGATYYKECAQSIRALVREQQNEQQDEDCASTRAVNHPSITREN